MQKVKDTIYLTVSQAGVQGMRKSFSGSKKGEIVVKLGIEVDKAVFVPPTIEKHVVVNNWQEDIDVGDVQFKDEFITEEEAKVIRDGRLEKMRFILEAQGFKVTASKKKK